MMKRLWGRIKCLFGRHGRGKRVDHLAHVTGPDGYDQFRMQCPRCGATWVRTVKAKAQP